jgi:hypothetical protein
MGGCYSYNYSERRETKREDWKSSLRSFVKNKSRSDLIKAYKAYFSSEDKPGFFIEVANMLGISSVENIPKEFPEIEYEVKFDVTPFGKGNEPSVKEYLDAFDFPAGGNARFLKDPVNSVSIGTNNFYGGSLDERLVVIEKGGNIYLKEKGEVMGMSTGVSLEQIVIKRTEKRYQVPASEAIKKVTETCKESGVEYRGKIRKEKGDAFILDSFDGRIYSMSFTRAHLMKPDEKEESGIQRQLELEYAGYLPFSENIDIGSEKQIVSGMVDLAKYTAVIFSEAPINSDWKMHLKITCERKYDFITGRKNYEFIEERLTVPLITGTRKKLACDVK